MKGRGPKSSVCPSKPGKSNFSSGISRDFARISRRRPKSLREKKFAFNFWPLPKNPLALFDFESQKVTSWVTLGNLEGDAKDHFRSL